MRTILITGPGGSGRTTVAAATALTAARAGTRTLVFSADRTDTLGAILGTPTGATPAQVSENLTAWRPDATAGFRDDLAAFQDRASNVLDLLGASRLDPEEVTPSPAPRNSPSCGPCATRRSPSGTSCSSWICPPPRRRSPFSPFPRNCAATCADCSRPSARPPPVCGPSSAGFAGVPMPSEWLYETAARWDTELGAVEAVLADRHRVVRLVAEPGPAYTDAVRSASLALALRGLRPDTLVANRAVPEEWHPGLVAQQRKALEEWQESYDVHVVPHLGHDPRGTDDLEALAVPGVNATPSTVEWPVVDQLAEDGVLVWHIPLPGAIREELDLIRRGDELVVTAGQFRRIVPLPSALRRCTVAGAALREGELRIRFAPDPDLWPRTP